MISLSLSTDLFLYIFIIQGGGKMIKKEMGTRTKYDLCVYICERINKELRDGYSKGNRNKDEKKENKQEEVRINKEMRKDGRTLRSCSWFSYDV